MAMLLPGQAASSPPLVRFVRLRTAPQSVSQRHETDLVAACRVLEARRSVLVNGARPVG